MEKYHSYSEATKRIDRGIENDYPFESITLCESIIADRIYSHLYWHKKADDIKNTAYFGILLKKLKNKSCHPEDWSMDGDLLLRIEQWIHNRNKLLHGIVTSIPKTPTDNIDTFIEEARATAIEGKSLVREVINWNRKSQIKA